MEPILKDGERVKVRVVEESHPVTPSFGEVVLARHEGILFVHRIAGRVSGGSRRNDSSAAAFRTKGDGRAHFDGWLTAPADILGIAFEVEGGGRRRSVQGGGLARLVNLVAGTWSTLCGHAYRVAIRLDRTIGAGGQGEGSDFRADVELLNRAGFDSIDWCLRLLVDRIASDTAVARTIARDAGAA